MFFITFQTTKSNFNLKCFQIVCIYETLLWTVPLLTSVYWNIYRNRFFDQLLFIKTNAVLWVVFYVVLKLVDIVRVSRLTDREHKSNSTYLRSHKCQLPLKWKNLRLSDTCSKIFWQQTVEKKASNTGPDSNTVLKSVTTVHFARTISPPREVEISIKLTEAQIHVLSTWKLKISDSQKYKIYSTSVYTI